MAPERTRHVANGRGPAVPVSDDLPGELFPAPGSAARRAVTLDNSIADTDIFPNLRHGRHATGRRSRDTGHTGPPLEPVAVLAPVEYDQLRPAEITDPEGDMFGLRKFNLGTVPASVTPPKSWRKAAWFSVACSAAALAALVSIAAVFVRHDGTRGSVDALPGLPSAPPASSGIGPDGASGQHVGHSRVPGDSTATGGTGADGTGVGADMGGVGGIGGVGGVGGASGLRGPTGGDDRTTGGGGGEGRPGDPGGPVTTGGDNAPPPSTFVPHNFPPEVVVYGNDGPPVIDGGVASNRSHTFYSEIATDPDAALASTAMSNRERRQVRREYEHVESVQVVKRKIFRGSGITRNTLILYKDDGSTEQVTRTLYFSRGSDPEITGEG